MLTEKEIRYLVKKKLLKEAPVAGTTLSTYVGGTGIGGSPPPSDVRAGGTIVSAGTAAATSILSTSIDGPENDQDDFKALIKSLNTEIDMKDFSDSYNEEQESEIAVRVIDAYMDEINSSPDKIKNAEMIFGDTGVREKLMLYYQKEITTQDLFKDADPIVQTKIAEFNIGSGNNQIRYNPVATSNITYNSATPGTYNPNQNNFPFYWLKFILDRDFDLTKGAPSGGSVTFDPVSGYPIFNDKDEGIFIDEVTELYQDTFNKFDSEYSVFKKAYDALRESFASFAGSALTTLGIADKIAGETDSQNPIGGSYFDDDEGLAYVHLLKKLIEKDSDQTNLPMTRMFFAKIAAEDSSGYAGGEDYEEVMSVFAVGEDHRVRSFLRTRSATNLRKYSNLKTVFPTNKSDGIYDAAYYYALPYVHVATDFGSKFSNALAFTGLTTKSSAVRKAQANLKKVIDGILSRRMDGAAAIANLDWNAMHEKKFMEKLGGEGELVDAINESKKIFFERNTFKSLIKKYLLTEKAASSTQKTESVGLEVKEGFKSFVDPNGLVFVHYGPSKIPVISPQIYLDKAGTKNKKAASLYELCYFSPNWTKGAKNPLEILSIFDIIYTLFKDTSTKDEFDLNGLAVYKATEILRLGEEMNKGVDRYGIKTTTGKPMNPKKNPPDPTELTDFSTAVNNESWMINAMAVKEVVAGIFDGIRKKEKGYDVFLKYLEGNKENIMLGANMTTTYAKALEDGRAEAEPLVTKDKEYIKEMYTYFAVKMPEFNSTQKQDLLDEMNIALEPVSGKLKLDLANLKGSHPKFSSAFLILMQKKISKEREIGYSDMLQLSNNFENAATHFSINPNIKGLYQFFRNLIILNDVPPKERIKMAAAGGNEIGFDQAFGTPPNDKIISAPLGSIPGGTTFNAAAGEQAMINFAPMLKDSDNTLSQNLFITLSYKNGNISKLPPKIEGRLGGNIKLGLRPWIKKYLVPTVVVPASFTGDVKLHFPPARYIGKGLLEEDFTKIFVNLLKEYSS